MHIPISHLRKIFPEWLSLLLQIGADLLQSGTNFIIANQGKRYCKLEQIYNKVSEINYNLWQLLRIGVIITSE